MTSYKKEEKTFWPDRREFVKAAGIAALSTAPLAPAIAALSSERAVALAEARRDELVDLLTRLIRIRSLSGETAEAAQAVVKDYLRELPYRIEETADRPSRYVDHPEFMPPNPPSDGPFINVVGHPADGSGRHAMFAHIDTHLIEDGWSTDPYSPVVRDGRMYGLGTGDDKGGVAAMLVAAAALAEAGERLPVVMSLHGKGGGSRGSLPTFERLKQSNSPLEAVLYVHPAETGRGLDDVKNEVQGVVDLALDVRGWRAPPMEIGSVDSSSWEEGGNAADTMMLALEHLRDGVYKNVKLNVGILDGGDRAGSVAEDARVVFRLKFGGSYSWRSLLQSVREELARLQEALPASADGKRFTLSLEPVGYRTNPGLAEWDSRESVVLRDAIEGVTGRAPDAYPNHYAGDIRYPIRLLGVPAYGIGSLGGGFYGPNEWIDIDDLVRLTAVCIQTLSGWSDSA